MNYPFTALCYIFFVCVCVCVYGILTNITYEGKTPQWILGCWTGLTPASRSMVKTKIPVYAADRNLVTHPSQ